MITKKNDIKGDWVYDTFFLPLWDLNFDYIFSISAHAADDPWIGVNWSQSKFETLSDQKFRDLHRKLVELKSEFQKLNSEAGGCLVFVSSVIWWRVYHARLFRSTHWSDQIVKCVCVWLVSLWSLLWSVASCNIDCFFLQVFLKQYILLQTLDT
jgi:hypothetical protein